MMIYDGWWVPDGKFLSLSLCDLHNCPYQFIYNTVYTEYNDSIESLCIVLYISYILAYYMCKMMVT